MRIQVWSYVIITLSLSHIIGCETEQITATSSFIAATPTVDILNTTIEVMEGGSVNITCTSTGIPTPTIEWELVSGSLPFTPVDAALVDPMIAQVSPLMFNEGSLTSVLPITNAVFPDHQGTYRCTGANTRDRAASSNNDTVQVTVLGGLCHTLCS